MNQPVSPQPTQQIPKREMNITAVTILVPMADVLEAVKRGKVHVEEEDGRKLYEADFEFCNFAGYPVDDADEDEIHQALIQEHCEGPQE